MIEKWRQMSGGERLRIQLLIAFCIVGCYGLLVYPGSSDRFLESKKMLSRKKNRIEIKASLDGVTDSGQSPKIIEQKILDVEERIRAVAAEFDELDSGFAPVNSSDVRQQLMLEVSTLAARTGVGLLSVSRKGATIKGNTALSGIDREIRRPLLVIKAYSGFWGLIDFLHGLKDLSFHVSVMNLKLYSSVPEGEQDHEVRLPDGYLFTSLEVSI